MVVRALMMIMIALPAISFGQTTEDNTTCPHKGMWRAQATISLGQKRGDFTHMYLHGDLGYHISENVEVRGDGYYFLNTLGDTSAFDFNHQLLFGAIYHFEGSGNLDPYVGVQPGVAMSQSSRECPDDTQDALPWQCHQATNPLMTLVGGANYYGSKWFHVFAQVRYVRGVHLGQALPVHLDELRFSFGLGFNIK